MDGLHNFLLLSLTFFALGIVERMLAAIAVPVPDIVEALALRAINPLVGDPGLGVVPAVITTSVLIPILLAVAPPILPRLVRVLLFV